LYLTQLPASVQRLELRSERADRRKGAMDGADSERRRPGESGQDVRDRRDSSLIAGIPIKTSASRWRFCILNTAADGLSVRLVRKEIVARSAAAHCFPHMGFSDQFSPGHVRDRAGNLQAACKCAGGKTIPY